MDETSSIDLKRKFIPVILQTSEIENDSIPALVKGLFTTLCEKTKG